MRPGELLPGDDPIQSNRGRRAVELTVDNTSRHTIFVSSHYPFFEANRRLLFDRAQAWGMHLDIPAGDSVRWGPGETKRVSLVAYGGQGIILGFHGLCAGPTTNERLPEALRRVAQGGFGHRPEAATDGA